MDGAPILDGYDAGELCPSGRGQQLIPWPNRIQDGSYEFEGRRHQLPLDEPERRNAIHGLVRWSPWTITDRAADHATLEHLLHPRPGYPFTLSLRVSCTLARDGLSVRTEATNLGPSTCPYGAGAHPYLAAVSGRVDTEELHVPAETVLQADERGLPVRAAPIAGTELDFRAPKAIGEVVLDHCFTDLERDDAGYVRVRFGERTLWADESYGYVMVFTGDPLPDVRRRSLAVEPMTCAPNGFRSGEGLIRLEPGETHVGTWGIAP